MKIYSNRPVESRRGMQVHRLLNCPRNAGSALLIVLILLSVMGTLVASNSVTLRRLKVELQLLEQTQNRATQARSLAFRLGTATGPSVAAATTR